MSCAFWMNMKGLKMASLITTLPRSMEELTNRLRSKNLCVFREQYGDSFTTDFETCVRTDGKMDLKRMAERLGVPAATHLTRDQLASKILRHEKCEEFFVRKNEVIQSEDFLDVADREKEMNITVEKQQAIFQPIVINTEIKSYEMLEVYKKIFLSQKNKMHEKHSKHFKPIYDALGI